MEELGISASEIMDVSEGDDESYMGTGMVENYLGRHRLRNAQEITSSTVKVKSSNESTNMRGAVECYSVAQRRIALLGIENAVSNPSAEIMERLRRLNERMKKEMPLVLNEQLSALEDSMRLLEEVRASRQARFARLGLVK